MQRLCFINVYISIMKKLTYLTTLIMLFSGIVRAQQLSFSVTTTDIANFWSAYDKITSTKDSAQQYQYLNMLFIEKGTPGLKAMMAARSYTDKSYIDAINKHPLFWQSIRANTLKANVYARDIAAKVMELRELYPKLQSAQIYFTMGALRSGGTTQGKMILIGSELSLAGKNTITSEFKAGEWNMPLLPDDELAKNVVFTNIHEYVHTQQKNTATNNLFAQSVMEGVAEFVAVKATGMASTLPALAYGRKNFEKVRQKFGEQLFNTGNGFWLYTNAKNEFGVRDLGYYAGYAICEKYYNKATNKKLAIKQMIELDYDNEAALAAYVDASGYFEVPVSVLKQRYEVSQPTVINLEPFKNNADNVSPATKQFTITFSAPMDKGFRNFELGPLGMDNLLKLKKVVNIAEDGRSLTFEVELIPDHRYQLVIGSGFRTADGINLKPYLIDFKTAAN